MPYETPYSLKWSKEDFTVHGYLATYAIGECRCVHCVSHWDEWVHQAEEIRGPNK